MNAIRADYTVSISELRKNPGQLIRNMEGSAVAVLNRNATTAYLVDPRLYEHMLDIIEDLELSEIAEHRLKEKHKAIEVNVDDL